jgi:hypothetical protein
MAKTKKYTSEDIKQLKNFLVGNRSSVFGIVYDYMISKGKDPFGKDSDEFWNKSKEFLTKRNNLDMKK